MFRRSCIWVLAFVFGLAIISQGVMGAPEETEAEEGPPIPLHTIEGVGGAVLTPMAYPVNPGPEGTVIGKPSVSAQAVWIGSKDMQNLAATVTIARRLELGYAINRLGLDDFNNEINEAGLDVGDHDIYLHHFNAKLLLIEEGMGDMSWVPAVSAGVHYKYNEDIDRIDHDLGGRLKGIGLSNNEGFDYTLTATKTVTCPMTGNKVILNAGARASKAAQFGLAGFSDDYRITGEGSIDMLVTDRLVIGGEYRQKESGLDKIDDLVEHEDDWWDLHAAYILNNNTVMYFVGGHAGGVLNHQDQKFFGAVLKYEF